MLSVKEVEYSIGRKEILRNVSTSFQSEMFHVIVGPNGSGKSTFLKSIQRRIKTAKRCNSYLHFT
jgi:iron complex transport system ATP-binding protein